MEQMFVSIRHVFGGSAARSGYFCRSHLYARPTCYLHGNRDAIGDDPSRCMYNLKSMSACCARCPILIARRMYASASMPTVLALSTIG